MSQNFDTEMTNMIMIEDKDGRVLVQKRIKYWKGIAFPGGHIEKGESITDSVIREAKEETGLPIVTELLSVNHLDLFKDVDIIQIGARNMQNFELLKEVGKTGKPILCERGIRTFETMTRNTLDLSAVPVLKEKTHLPVIIDPSHATGIARLVEPMSLASIGAGADGLIIEVHNDPKRALCDGAQSLNPEQFDNLMGKINNMLPIVGKHYDGKNN